MLFTLFSRSLGDMTHSARMHIVCTFEAGGREIPFEVGENTGHSLKGIWNNLRVFRDRMLIFCFYKMASFGG